MSIDSRESHPEEGQPGCQAERSAGNGRERGIALVVVLLLLATTTVIGIGAMSQAVSDMKIAANENCAVRVLNAAEVGIEDGMSAVYDLQGQGDRFNTISEQGYNINPMAYWNIKNCGNLPPQNSDADAACTPDNLVAKNAAPDGTLSPRAEEGGEFSYFFEYRLINPTVGSKMGAECGRAAVGEQLDRIKCRDYVIHSIGRGCDSTQYLDAGTQKTERSLGTHEYS